MSLVLATRNPHKLREFAVLLDGVELVALPDGIELPPETGATFEANALPKARTAAQATGELAFGDDSGIEADALDGAPGVRSARFAGEDATDAENLAALIEQAPPGSALAYVCVIALVDPRTGDERTFEGRCTGTMATEPRGSGGFGYDPIFVPDDRDDGRTMAELDPAEKDAISHRGRAARALLAHLRAGESGAAQRGGESGGPQRGRESGEAQRGRESGEAQRGRESGGAGSHAAERA